MKFLGIFGVFVGVTLFGFAYQGHAQTIDSNTQTGSESLAVEDFTINLTKGSQSAINQSVPLTLNFMSRFDSNEAFVRWSGPPGVEFLDKEEVFFSMFEDTEYDFTQRVKFKEAGTYRIVAQVEAWRSEANYLSSESIDITVDENLEIVPADPEYQQNKIIWLVARIAIVVVIGGGLVAGGIFGIKKFKAWLSED